MNGNITYYYIGNRERLWAIGGRIATKSAVRKKKDLSLEFTQECNLIKNVRKDKTHSGLQDAVTVAFQ